ncbi:MAG: serine hydrolase domain-containing protein [Gemmataceae bacterium]
MNRMILAFAVAGLTLAPSSRADEADKTKTLEKPLRAEFEKTKAPGAIVGIYREGKPVLELALGKADVENDRAMATDCHFHIASVSKVFVGTTLLTLVDEGKVSLDDKISKYVEGVPNGDKITLRHLGSHRSGLFNHISSKTVKEMFAAKPEKWWTVEELLAVPLKEKTYFEPDGGHHYSNANTVLLALVIEKATGKKWGDEVAARVIKPLGLKNTTIPTDNSLPKPYCEGYALGTKDGPFFNRGDVRHNVTKTSPSWWGPAGNMISTLGDLSKAAKPLATGKLLKEATRKELHGWTKADQEGYEYGFHIERTKGMVGHDGDVPGYQTAMYYLPEHDAVVVAMVNLYGWSVRGMPASQLAKVAVEQCFSSKK